MRRYEVLYDWCLGGCLPVYDAPKGSKQWRPHSGKWEMVPQPEWTVGPRSSHGPRAVLGWCDDVMTPLEALKYLRLAVSQLPDDDEALLIVSLRPEDDHQWRTAQHFRLGLLFVPEAKKDWFLRMGPVHTPYNPTGFPQKYLYGVWSPPKSVWDRLD